MYFYIMFHDLREKLRDCSNFSGKVSEMEIVFNKILFPDKTLDSNMSKRIFLQVLFYN